jgi:anti-sigma B factor antagonist
VPYLPIKTANPFRCQRYRVCDRVALVAVAGEVDLATAPKLRSVLLGALEPDVPDLIVDLTEVTLVDSTGLSALVACWHRAGELGGTVGLAGVSPSVRKVFELTTLDQLLGLYPTVSAAVAAMSDGISPAERRTLLGASEASATPRRPPRRE